MLPEQRIERPIVSSADCARSQSGGEAISPRCSVGQTAGAQWQTIRPTCFAQRQVFEGPVDVLGVFTGACLRAADGRDQLQLIGALVLVSSGLLAVTGRYQPDCTQEPQQRPQPGSHRLGRPGGATPSVPEH